VQDTLDDRNRNQRGKTRLHEFAFASLMTCAHCGCSLSGQIQKERYIYYHCTGFKGDCGEPYVREKAIAEHFAKQIRTQQLPTGCASTRIHFVRVTSAVRGVGGARRGAS